MRGKTCAWVYSECRSNRTADRLGGVEAAGGKDNTQGRCEDGGLNGFGVEDQELSLDLIQLRHHISLKWRCSVDSWAHRSGVQGGDLS